MNPEPPLRARLQAWDEGAWSLAALVVALRGGPLAAAALEVLGAVDLVDPVTNGVHLPEGATAEQLASQAAAPLVQLAALLSGEPLWTRLPDEALVAQGQASGQMAAAFRAFVLPRLDDLADRLERPGARMLDVGTGVGAIAQAFATEFPAITVTGVDVWDRVLELARAALATSAVADRVELRQQDVAELAEVDRYDLAWVPAPFVPVTALGPGLAAVARALKPGGWLLLGHGKFGADPRENALNRFKTLVYGGTSYDDQAAQRALTQIGLTAVTTLPTPPGAPGLTVGCKPA